MPKGNSKKIPTHSSESEYRGDPMDWPAPASKQVPRHKQQYSSEPADVGQLFFTRNKSFYQTDSSDPKYRDLLAADVRRQVQQAPASQRTDGLYGYPYEFNNREGLPLQAAAPYREYPLNPTGMGNYSTGGDPGPNRAIYNNQNRQTFDVAYKNDRLPPNAPREGRRNPRAQYSVAEYRPAPTYTEVKTTQKHK